jgi:hypothetical protein
VGLLVKIDRLVCYTNGLGIVPTEQWH